MVAAVRLWSAAPGVRPWAGRSGTRSKCSRPASSTPTRTFYSLGTQISSATSMRAASQCACVPGHHGVEQPQGVECERTAVEEVPRFRWDGFGSDLSESQKQAIHSLSPKLPNRCKALMTRVVCLSPQDENLGALLAFWVKAMKPKRSDWLLVLKELKAMESPLLAEVLEYALLEDSFEANVRDYTKLIHIYGKQKLLQKAENAFHALKGRGFPCDQVMLTAMMDLYSKAGDLSSAKEIYEDIVLLGLPLDKRAYGSMIMAYIRAEMLDKAEDLIKQMEGQQIFAGKEVYKALLRAYSYKGNSDGTQRVFDAIQFAGIVPDTKLCTLLVNAYCLSSQIDEAVCVIRNMRSAGLKPCDKCIALVLGAYEKANGLERALAFLTELEENGVVIGQEPSQFLAGWFRRLGVVHEVEQVLKELSEDRKSRHNFVVSLEQKSVVTFALTLLTSSQAILIVWSKRAGRYEYCVTTANFWVEALKCLLSLVALYRTWNIQGVTEDNRLSTSFDEVRVYLIPAIVYMVKNLLQYYLFAYVDAPAYQIQKNLNIISTEIGDNIDEECAICMEINNKVVLPTCSHAMCIKCYRDWKSRSQSCPFCRDSLKGVNSAGLWIYTDNQGCSRHGDSSKRESEAALHVHRRVAHRHP